MNHRPVGMPFLGKVAVIVMLGVVAGAAHSWLTPVVLRLEDLPVDHPIDVPPPNPAGAANASTPAAAAAPGASISPAPNGTVAAEAPADLTSLPLKISLTQARALFDAGAMFIDAREDHERIAGWIAGSVHLTAGMMTGATLPESFQILDPSQPNVIYCGGGACDASENLAILLRQAGFQRLHIMHDGFPAWQAAGLPVEGDAASGGGVR